MNFKGRRLGNNIFVIFNSQEWISRIYNKYLQIKWKRQTIQQKNDKGYKHETHKEANINDELPYEIYYTSLIIREIQNKTIT